MEGIEVKPTPLVEKRGAALLVKQFFGAENKEIMSLTGEERIQLGSAIAKTLGLTPAQLAFTPVEY